MTQIVITRNHKRYRISRDGSKYHVSIDRSSSLFSSDWYRVGTTHSLENAYTLIRSHSGSDIKEIKDV